MEAEKFENILMQMSKPKVTHLKHQDMLANAITNAKDKSVLSLWWLSIPLYIIAALLMKTCFMPNTTLASNIHELASKGKYSALFIFVVIPILFIAINVATIRKIYFLSGSPKSVSFLKEVWFNLLIIVSSILILIIYLF